MNITANGLTRATGAAAAVAGAIFIGVQINHPPADVAHIVTTDVAVRETAKIVFTVLALAGFAGMFVHNRHRFGVLGLAGYLLVSVGFLALFAVQVVVACVLPALAASNPGYVQDVLDAAVGGSPDGDIGGMQVLFNVSGAGYMLGGLVFGIALFRAGMLARWASALLAVATVSTAALAVLPESFNRPFAVPTGIALMGLGISLWRTTGTGPTAHGTDAGSPTAATHGEPTPVR
jgi:hypothetical protein